MARPYSAVVVAASLGSAAAFTPSAQQPPAQGFRGSVGSVAAAPLPVGDANTSTWAGTAALPCGALAAVAALSVIKAQHSKHRSLVKPRTALAAQLPAAGERPKAAGMKPKEASPPPPPYNPATDEVGAVPFFFDPLGFSPVGERRKFWNLRDSEIKHGRVAMLAAIGLVFQHFVHVPVPTWKTYVKVAQYGMGAITVWYGPGGFFGYLVPFVFVTGFLEIFWFPNNQGRNPGNFGNPLGRMIGVDLYDDFAKLAELVNGRFAMISVTGILLAELATGKDAVEQLGL